MIEKNEYVSVSVACEMLNVSKTVIKRLVEEGEIASWRTPGSHRRLHYGSLVNYKNRRDMSPFLSIQDAAIHSGLSVEGIVGLIEGQEVRSCVLDDGCDWVIKASLNRYLEALV